MSGSAKRFSGALRVFCLLALTTVVSSVWLAAHAKAAGEKALFGFADHMMRFAGAPNQTTPVELKLNGASFYISHAAIDAPVSAVLDAFQAKCAAKNRQIGSSWAEAAGLSGRTLSGLSAVKELAERPGLLDGVLRSEGKDKDQEAGFVVCMEAPDGSPLDPSKLLEGVQSFLETGDAADVGHMRYVRVERSGQRGAERSVLVAIWTEGSLPLRTMFPAKGDAPGRDPEGLPRPPHARRLLSSEQVGRDVLLTIYGQEPPASEKAEKPERLGAAELGKFYRSMLQERGFTLLEHAHSASLLVARKAGQMVTVSFAADEAGHGIATLSTRPD